MYYFCFLLHLGVNIFTASIIMFLLFQCSTTCGEGRRERYVSCRDHEGNIADDAFCVHLPRPEAAQACMEKPCGQWRTGAWTPVWYYYITYPHPHLPHLLCPEVDQACMGETLRIVVHWGKRSIVNAGAFVQCRCWPFNLHQNILFFSENMWDYRSARPFTTSKILSRCSTV